LLHCFHSFPNPIHIHKFFPEIAVKEIVVKVPFGKKGIAGEKVSETLMVYMGKVSVTF
jgi:hypothetical protein